MPYDEQPLASALEAAVLAVCKQFDVAELAFSFDSRLRDGRGPLDVSLEIADVVLNNVPE